MNFANKLKEYMDELKCSNAVLSKESGLSESTISRYKSGERIPNNPSKQLDSLIKGLSKLYKNKNIKTENEKTIKNSFNKIIKSYDTDKLINNFNELINTLNINISDFSKLVGFDPSYLSRIRNKERKISNPDVLIEGICKYVVRNFNDENSKEKISKLINCSLKNLCDDVKYKEEISFWLCKDYETKKEEIKDESNVNNFLNKLNDFDLNEYIKAIKFDEIKVPTIPFNIPKSKNYYGLEEMKQGELDFLKSTVLSKNTKEVFMCNDMQMDDLASDLDFGKKWMFGIAMMLKKGIHLNFIHNIDRPFNEMMLGLESWIPIYMTGQVSPYYFNNLSDNIYSHLNYISDNIVLTGECIKGYHSKAKYYLTNNKTEMDYYKEKAKLLLKKAKPLMNIYTSKDKKLFNDFYNNLQFKKNNIKIINSSLPIYTINEDLLLRILKSNNIEKNDIDYILNYVRKRKIEINNILKNNKINDVISIINEYEFNSFPPILDLSNLFYDRNIYYNYEEYLEHLNNTKEFNNKNNYKLEINNNLSFRNIQITINFNNWVIISKNNNPKIHFVIEHPKLCSAIENYVAPVNESKNL